MRESRTQRLTGALLALCMLVQPLVPLAIADVSPTETKSMSASSSKESTWAGVLQGVDGQLPKFHEYLRGRQQLYKEMQTCIDLWAKIFEEKGAQSQQPKLLAVAKEYGKRFTETLTNADDFTARFSQDLGSVGGRGGQFILNSPRDLTGSPCSMSPKRELGCSTVLMPRSKAFGTGLSLRRSCRSVLTNWRKASSNKYWMHKHL